MMNRVHSRQGARGVCRGAPCRLIIVRRGCGGTPGKGGVKGPPRWARLVPTGGGWVGNGGSHRNPDLRTFAFNGKISVNRGEEGSSLPRSNRLLAGKRVRADSAYPPLPKYSSNDDDNGVLGLERAAGWLLASWWAGPPPRKRGGCHRLLERH